MLVLLQSVCLMNLGCRYGLVDGAKNGHDDRVSDFLCILTITRPENDSH